MLCLDFYIILSEVWISGNVYICVKVWLFLRFIGFIDLSKPSSNAEGFRVRYSVRPDIRLFEHYMAGYPVI